MITRIIKSFFLPKQQQPDSCPFPNDNKNNIKVIKSDGRIFLFHRPILVSQLLLDHPDYLVCPEDSFFIGKNIPSLPPHHKLLPGHNYFLLPRHVFLSVLSFPTLASFASSPFNRAAAAFCKPFHIHKSPCGFLRIQVSDHFISLLLLNQQQQQQQIMGNNNNNHRTSATGILCTTPQLDKDYRQLVVSSTNNWKPKLHTISETTRRKKNFSSFRIIKRSSSTSRNKTPTAQMPRSQQQQQQHAHIKFSIANFKFRLKK